MSSAMARLLIYVDNLILACNDMDVLAVEAAARSVDADKVILQVFWGHAYGCLRQKPKRSKQ